MAEKENRNNPKDLIEAVPEEIAKVTLEIAPTQETPKEAAKETTKEVPQEAPKPYSRSRSPYGKIEATNLDAWVPKTEIGRKVKAGEEKDLDKLLSSGKKILEAEIVESLLKNIQIDLLSIGQAKGKFGGGKRRAWRQTQKKTKEGNVLTFACMAVVGDMQGHVGVGYGRAKETLPARAKAIRQAKLQVMKITRGFESKEEHTDDPHTVPFVVEGKCGSIRIKLIPAPRGTGLVIGDQGKKILKLAGIRDVYAVTRGQTRTTFNVAKALMLALKKTSEMKL